MLQTVNADQSASVDVVDITNTSGPVLCLPHITSEKNRQIKREHRHKQKNDTNTG